MIPSGQILQFDGQNWVNIDASALSREIAVRAPATLPGAPNTASGLERIYTGNLIPSGNFFTITRGIVGMLGAQDWNQDVPGSRNECFFPDSETLPDKKIIISSHISYKCDKFDIEIY